jgi:YD repeat-containing protein
MFDLPLWSARLSGTPNAVTTTFTYEPTYSRLASVVDPLGHTSTFAYDSLGNLVSATDALNHQTTDAAGRRTGPGTTIRDWRGLLVKIRLAWLAAIPCLPMWVGIRYRGSTLVGLPASALAFARWRMLRNNFMTLDLVFSP